MRLNILLVVIAINCMSNAAAQDVTLADMLAAESKKTHAKQKEELAKTAPETPPISLNQVASQILVKPKPINPEPRTISVYGVAPDYKAEMSINGAILLVKTGQTIQNYTVASINPIGVTLLTVAQSKKIKKSRKKVQPANSIVADTSTAPKKVTTFVKKKVTNNTVTAALSYVQHFFPLQQQ